MRLPLWGLCIHRHSRPGAPVTLVWVIVARFSFLSYAICSIRWRYFTKYHFLPPSDPQGRESHILWIPRILWMFSNLPYRGRTALNIFCNRWPFLARLPFHLFGVGYIPVPRNHKRDAYRRNHSCQRLCDSCETCSNGVVGGLAVSFRISRFFFTYLCLLSPQFPIHFPDVPTSTTQLGSRTHPYSPMGGLVL